MRADVPKIHVSKDTLWTYSNSLLRKNSQKDTHAKQALSFWEVQRSAIYR